ncbi:hypothetical protein BGZ83_006337 [Gryganskiella cystojenkinii]|nr:hypothetical protein BGZ83_006337 [Gryganskiella cystojenkinii]
MPVPASSSDGTIWYLAYGSNMDPKVLSGRRKIKPLESKPVIVPGYWLSFDIGGLPFLEPCFASILKMDPARMHQRDYAVFVHNRTRYGQVFSWDENHPERSYPPTLQGVVHKITEHDWRKVIESEGGWGHDVPTGYDQIEVDCQVVGSSGHIAAQVLTARPLSIKTQCQPSARYKNLLTAGAAHHNLDPEYQMYLSSIVPYECSGRQSRIARAIMSVVNMPMVLAFSFLVRRNKGKPIEQHTPPPYWMAWYFDKANRFSNAIHDYVVAPILGSGRCSTREQQILTRKKIEETRVLEERQKQSERQAEQEPEIVKAVEQVFESTAP